MKYDMSLAHKGALYASSDGEKTLFLSGYITDSPGRPDHQVVYCYGSGFLPRAMSWKKFLRTIRYHKLEKIDLQGGDMVLITNPKHPKFGNVFIIKAIHRYMWVTTPGQVEISPDGSWSGSFSVKVREIEVVFRK